LGRRRKGYGLNASLVIQALVDFASDPARVEEAARKYADGLSAFASDPNKIRQAEMKLAAWYSVLRNKIPIISRAYAEAREEYKRRLAALKGVTIGVKKPVEVIAR